MLHQIASERLRALQKTAQSPEVLRRELERLLQIYPDFTPALAALGDLAERAGNFPLAQDFCRKSLAILPRDGSALVKLARLKHERFGETAEALQLARKALTFDPTHQEALACLAALCQRKTPGGAIIGQPLVSAIVSACKSERFLRGCLEDLERQSIADRLEIIVVDSHSPQRERAIVEEFQKRFSNIVYIRTKERETVYGAWNRGIRAARGKYVTTANTDDRHRVDALELLADTLDEHPDVTLVYADCLITAVENETMETTQAMRRYQWLDFNPQDLFVRGCFCGPQPMWRRDAHDEHGYFDAAMVSAGDYEFWLRLAQNRKFLHVPETLGLYLDSPASIEHANRDIAAKETETARQRYHDSIMSGKPSFRPKLLEPTVAVEAMIDGAPKPTTTPSAPAVLPPVAKIGQLDEARQLFGQKNYSAAWNSASATVNARPFHPEGFLLLAEIALAAGDGQSAKVCVQRARELAPNWKAPKEFLKQKHRTSNIQHPTSNAGWLKLTDALSTPRSALRASLTVCLIVKNEEQFLAQCLKSVHGLAQQVVVVDTGSTDRTVDIAKSFGAEIHSFAWCDDFAAARNAALEHATGDWVLMLDADEELPAAEHARLQADMKRADVIAFRLPLINKGEEGQGKHCVPRLFRNAPGAYYYTRIHEQVFPSLVQLGKAWGMKTAIGTEELLHHGYTKEIIRDRDKIGRNLKLLRQAVVEFPNDANLQMNLGLELVHSDDLPAGLVHYREAFRLMSAQAPSEVTPELREVLLTQFTCHLYKVRAHDEIVQALNSPLAKQGGLTASLHFALGLAFFELKKFREAAEEMRQCLAQRKQPSLAPINTDILTAVPHHCLALSLMKLGDHAGAEKAFKSGLAGGGDAPSPKSASGEPPLLQLKLDYAKFLAGQNRQLEALQQLNELVAANARNAAAWRLGGEIALGKSEFLEFARDWTS